MLIPKQVMAVAKCASKDKERPDIQTVLIERDASGRPAIFATDGNKGIGVSWNELEPDNWPSSAVCEACAVAGFQAKVLAEDVIAAQSNVPSPEKDLPATGCALLDERGGERARFFASDTKHHATHDAPNCLDRTFPDLRSVLAGRRALAKKDVRVAVNAAKLADLLTIVRNASGTDTVVLSLSKEDEMELRVDAWNNAQAIGVTGMLFPMKIEEGDWLAHEDVLSQVCEPAFALEPRAQTEMENDTQIEIKSGDTAVKTTLKKT